MSHGVTPRLAIVRVGDDPASVAYQRQISRAFARHGLAASAELLPASASQDEAAAHVNRLCADPDVHGVLLQLPLPPGMRADPLVDQIKLDLDVEGVHPYHAGLLALGRPTRVPSTPMAGLELLRRSDVELTGRLAVVVGRSPIVGRPLASLLILASCTVVVCHTRTRDLGQLTRQADLLFVAAGRPGLVDGSMVRPGATVIDFGTSEVDGRLVGDVDYDSAVRVAGAITPVPGGTGPVTTALLGRSLVALAEDRLA